MKLSVYSLVISIVLNSLLFPQNVFSYSQKTHQYIVREAYKLLKLQLGQDIPTLSHHIGNQEEDKSGYDPELPFIVAGAWGEDEWDPIYGDITGTYITATIHHFWDPDDNPNSISKVGYISPLLSRCGKIEGSIKSWSAFDKARAYAYGRYMFDKDNINGSTFWLGIPWVCEGYGNFGGFHIFFDGGITGLSKSATWQVKCSDGVGRYGPEREITPGETLYNVVIYNTLGRLCHLLGDMSVPAHIHLDPHYSACWDYYETIMDINGANSNFATYWNSNNIYSLKGGFINPFCGNSVFSDPLYFLFYTTAQIADRFPSRHASGDDNYENIGEISEIIEASCGPTTSIFENGEYSYPHTYSDLECIRDAAFPYVIRATAGLLYWFAVETGLINSTECPFDELYLQNQQLEGKNYIFKATNLVKAGRNVDNNQQEGNFLIKSTAKNVAISSQGEIQLKDGFISEQGSDVHIFIKECDHCSK